MSGNPTAFLKSQSLTVPPKDKLSSTLHIWFLGRSNHLPSLILALLVYKPLAHPTTQHPSTPLTGSVT